jgi:aspartate racemase
VITPRARDRAIVHEVIFGELCIGLMRDESRQQYQRIIGELVAAGAEGIILGCTEIELLLRAEDSPVPLLATTRLHVEAAVARSLHG